MIFGLFVLCVFLYISLAEAQYPAYDPGDDEEDYIPVLLTTYEVYPQDDLDAEAIVKKSMSETAFASILPYREKIRRMSIIREIGDKNNGVDYITEDYIPQTKSSTPFKDLIFGLTKNENVVLSAYLQVFFDRKDETWIIIGMVLSNDIQQMMATYDKYYSPRTFKELRKKQRHPFENMLRVWVRQNREPNEKGDLDENKVAQDANALRCENDTGGWKENRDQLESILMKKSIKYALAVIGEFEKAVGKLIEEVIQGNVQCHGLNHNLADAYSAIAKCIKNRRKYITEIMAQYCDGSDKWSAWIMCLAVVSPQEWPKIDAEFQIANPGETLSKFIQEKMTDDEVMAEMIAAIMDPEFKPTTFAEIPLTEGVGPEPTPPPASPTAMAPIPNT